MNGGRLDGGGERAGPGRGQTGLPWEPPCGPSRVAGGLLGVIGGEADGWGDTFAVPVHGPVAGALVDVAHAYIHRAGEGVPAEAARRHEGATAPGWLLAVAMVRPSRADLVADTLELATVAGVPRRSLGACVAYVELAAGLFAGLAVERAVQAAAGGMVSVDLFAVADPERATPALCGDTPADALSAGAWALLQDSSPPEVMAVIRRMSTPGVAAAVAGLLGLRDGCGALPPRWHEGSGPAAVCDALAPGLVRSRSHGPARTCALRAAGAGTDRTAQALLKTSAGTAETGPLPRPEPGESGGCEEAVVSSGTSGPPGSSGWFEPIDRTAGPAPLAPSYDEVVVGDHVQVGVGVSADAVTEETEAIEETVPATAGVGQPMASTADEWVGRSTTRRQLEGAVLR